jgi:hypothetical protein
VEDDRLLVEADERLLRIGRLSIEVEDLFDRCDERGPHAGEAPVLVLPGLEVVFLSACRMVSGEMRATKLSCTALPANSRSVQWSCPIGAGLQAMAMRWAICSPESA